MSYCLFFEKWVFIQTGLGYQSILPIDVAHNLYTNVMRGNADGMSDQPTRMVPENANGKFALTFVGNDPAKWYTEPPAYRNVIYQGAVVGKAGEFRIALFGINDAFVACCGEEAFLRRKDTVSEPHPMQARSSGRD